MGSFLMNPTVSVTTKSGHIPSGPFFLLPSTRRVVV